MMACLFRAWGITAWVGMINALSFLPSDNDTLAKAPGTSNGLFSLMTVNTLKVRVLASISDSVANTVALNFLSLPASVKEIGLPFVISPLYFSGTEKFIFNCAVWL